MYTAKISGTGHYVPERIVTNEYLSTLMETNDEWITERTGIRERRWVEKGDGNTAATMGIKAARNAIEVAGIEPAEIGHIVFATISPDYYFPGCGVQVQEALGIHTAGATDVRNACSGFIYALSVGNAFVQTGMYEHVLVVASELQSPFLDKTTRGRGVSVIFGDGAGAVVLSRAKNGESGIKSCHLHSEGKNKEELTMKGFGTQHWIGELLDNGVDPDIHYPQMNGNFVFKNAVVRFGEVIGEALAKNGLTPDKIDCLIPHQANLRIAQFIQK
ncbi:MAG: beta-ketoacyl-ACP synthase 3, partial [Schleiferiaceae bacterium]|nr:beta-ketoacyl-ACP synthase 3 [Schleiferiaceae bacterium]